MKHYAIFLFILLPFLNLFAQEQGFPIIRNYTPKEYNGEPRIWTVTQDHKGIMYFGGGDGVLEYDGINWRNIAIGKKAGCYDLAVAADGTIYVAANNDFGYLLTDANGFKHYQSLKDTSMTKLGTLNTIQITSQFVYFQSSHFILQYSPNTKKITQFKSDIEGRFIGDFVHKDTYYIHLIGKGLMKIEDNKLKPANQSEFFSDKYSFREALAFSADTWLIPTLNKGLYLYQPDKNNVPQPFLVSMKDFFVDNSIYSSHTFRNEYFVLGSINKGALLIDKKGKALQHYDNSKLLQSNDLYGMGIDTTQNIWLTLVNGISKTQHSLDLSYWDKYAGLNNTATNIIRFRKTIYITTGTEVYFIDDTNKINKVQNIPTGQNWDFLNYTFTNSEAKKDSVLLVGTIGGVYEIRGTSAKQIYKGGHALKMRQSLKNSSRIFITDDDSFVSLRFEKGKWISEGKWEGINDNIRGIAEDADGDIWLGTYRNGVIRITSNTDTITKPKKVRYYVEKDGFSLLADILPFSYKNSIIWGSKTGLYKHNNKTDKFEPFCDFGEQFCNGSRDGV
jgi:ligand-binding sensor domain-containing protein